MLRILRQATTRSPNGPGHPRGAAKEMQRERRLPHVSLRSEGAPAPRGGGTPLRAAPKFCSLGGGADLKAAPAANFCESEGRAGFSVQASRRGSDCIAAAPPLPS